MELDSFYNVFSVAQSHDHPVCRPSRHFKARRHGFGLHYERVVTPGFNGTGNTGEDGLAIVVNGGRLAVCRRVANDFAAVDIAHALMSEAYAQDGDPAGEAPQYVVGNSAVQGSAWTWRDDNVARC